MKIRKARPDEIDPTITHIQVGGLSRPSSTKTAKATHPSATMEDRQLTGLDYAAQWPDEMKVIHYHGPFTPEELTHLSFEQLSDYYYVSSWILREEGKQGFVAARGKLREFFVTRLQSGKRLRPI